MSKNKKNKQIFPECSEFKILYKKVLEKVECGVYAPCEAVRIIEIIMNYINYNFALDILEAIKKGK